VLRAVITGREAIGSNKLIIDAKKLLRKQLIR
jgi:hypothetical protein